MSSNVWNVNTDGNLNNNDANNPGGSARPALSLNLGSVIFKSALVPSLPAIAGQISNPFLLYCAKEYLAPSTNPSVNAQGKIEIAFAKDAAHVYTDTADTTTVTGLISKFTVTQGGTAVTIDAAEVDGGRVILTPDPLLTPGDAVTVTYNAYRDIDTDGIGFPETRTVLMGFEAPPTPTPPGPDPTPTPTPKPYDKSPDVRSVSVVIDGKTYEGTVDGDKITLNVPTGTDVSNLNIAIAGYPGATVTPAPPYDFSNGPVKIKVTSPDGSTTKEYTITVVVAVPQPVATTILNALAAGCTAKLTQNNDGTWGVEILIPFASGFTPTEIATIAAALSGLSNVRFFYVDENGTSAEISARRAGEKYLKITGTAADKAALANVVLSSVSVWKKNDTTEYKQSMNLKLSEIPGGKPAEEPASRGGSSGCDAGALGLLGLALSGLYLWRKQS